jgi:predicted nucleic acid-binding protein
MNVVDSSGWIEYLTDGTNADFFTTPIRDKVHLVVPTISIYEVFKKFLQQSSESDALKVVGIMSQGIVLDLTTSTAVHAAKLSHDHKISVADALMLASARAENATLWTQDEHLRGFPDVKFVAKIG